MDSFKMSSKLRALIKLSQFRAYRIAQIAGINPSTLSKLMCGIEKVKPQDPRIISVGKVLGLRPEECFDREA